MSSFKLALLGGHLFYEGGNIVKEQRLRFVSDAHGVHLHHLKRSVPPARLDMAQFIASLVAACHAVFGALWPLHVVLPWPSDYINARSKQMPGARASTWIALVCTSPRWALVVFRRPCVDREAWDVVLVDPLLSGAMSHEAVACVSQLAGTFGLPQGLDGLLRSVEPPRQHDALSCGQRVAHFARQALTRRFGDPLRADWLHEANSDIFMSMINDDRMTSQMDMGPYLEHSYWKRNGKP